MRSLSLNETMRLSAACHDAAITINAMLANESIVEIAHDFVCKKMFS